MSVVIDEVEKELSKEYRTRRNGPTSLTVYSTTTKPAVRISTEDSRSYWCANHRSLHGIGKILYRADHIIEWTKQKL